MNVIAKHQRRITSLIVLFLSAFGAWGQQLAYPAKYYVYKIGLYRRVPGGTVEQPLSKWDVKMILVTGQNGVQIYKTAGDAQQRKAVGAPFCQLRNVDFSKSWFEDGLTTEMYGVTYRGNIVPPADKVSNSAEAVASWITAVEGGSALKIVWFMDKRGVRRGESMLNLGTYSLIFYCVPASD